MIQERKYKALPFAFQGSINRAFIPVIMKRNIKGH